MMQCDTYVRIACTYYYYIMYTNENVYSYKSSSRENMGI